MVGRLLIPNLDPIPIYGVEMSADNSSSFGSSTGGGVVGRVEISPVTMAKVPDEASILLMDHATRGFVLTEAVVELTDAGTAYLQITLTNALVSLLATDSDDGAGERFALTTPTVTVVSLAGDSPDLPHPPATLDTSLPDWYTSQIGSLTWGVSQLIADAGGGSSAGKPVAGAVEFTHPLDEQLTLLFEQVVEGRHVAEATVVNGGDKYQFEDVIVKAVAIEATGAVGDTPRAAVAIVYGQITRTFDGGPSSCFNFITLVGC